MYPKKLLIMHAVVILSLGVYNPGVAQVPVTQNLIVQLDAENLTVNDPNGNPRVTNWTDQAIADGSNDFAQSDPSQAPILLANAVNGLPAVCFSSGDPNGFLMTPHDPGLNPGTGGYTVFMVLSVSDFDTDSSSVYQMSGNFWLAKGNTANSADEGFSIWGWTNNRIQFRLGTADIFDTPHRSARFFSLPGFEEFFIVTMVLDGMNEDAYVNGSDTPLGTFQGGTYDDPTENDGINPDDDLLLGLKMDGKIAEVLIYNAELTSEELDNVGSYLAAKYLIGSLYPPGSCEVLLLNEQARDIFDLFPDCEINLSDFALFSQEFGLNYDPASN